MIIQRVTSILALLGLLAFAFCCCACTFKPTIVETDPLTQKKTITTFGWSFATKTAGETISIPLPDGRMLTYSTTSNDEQAVPLSYIRTGATATVLTPVGAGAGTVLKKLGN